MGAIRCRAISWTLQVDGEMEVMM